MLPQCLTNVSPISNKEKDMEKGSFLRNLFQVLALGLFAFQMHHSVMKYIEGELIIIYYNISYYIIDFECYYNVSLIGGKLLLIHQCRLSNRNC